MDFADHSVNMSVFSCVTGLFSTVGTRTFSLLFVMEKKDWIDKSYNYKPGVVY